MKMPNYATIILDDESMAEKQTDGRHLAGTKLGRKISTGPNDMISARLNRHSEA